MSEKVTIGGVVYESVGSNKANLLLRCNGTAKIQWGNKLIDLIKNGKIASEGVSETIFSISNESEAKSNGIYIIDSKNIFIQKDKENYKLATPEFSRGMIIMHSGITDIPEGWAICDGNEYTYNNIASKTPDLRNRFIKAVGDINEIKSEDNLINNAISETQIDFNCYSLIFIMKL